ncbi:MAG: inositol monophosphatase [Puniceicoccaceae bacterium]|nr:MAG: inositol monophosphatase [Puniceicoccaceae bacterium]
MKNHLGTVQDLRKNGKWDYDYEQDYDYGLGEGVPLLNSGPAASGNAGGAAVDLRVRAGMPGRVSSATSLQARIEAGRSAVMDRCAFLHLHFGRSESRWKEDGSRVTPADLAVSRDLFSALAARFSGDCFFSEEMPPEQGELAADRPFSWVLDPIDGTNNYALGIPMCAIALGLLHEGEPVYGWVYDFGQRVLLHGGPGRGLWAGQERIRPEFRAPGRQTVVAVHTPLGQRFAPWATGVMERFKLRSFGSGALHLAYAALGRVDAAADFTIKVWDITAGVALCRESGAHLEFFGVNPFPVRAFDVRMRPLAYVAGSPEVCREVVKNLPPDAGRFSPV